MLVRIIRLNPFSPNSSIPSPHFHFPQNVQGFRWLSIQTPAYQLISWLEVLFYFMGGHLRDIHCITWQSTILISSHQWKKWGSCLWQNQLLKITTSCRLINMTHHRLAKNKTKKSIWLNVSQKHMLIKKKLYPWLVGRVQAFHSNIHPWTKIQDYLQSQSHYHFLHSVRINKAISKSTSAFECSYTFSTRNCHCCLNGFQNEWCIMWRKITFVFHQYII